MFGPFSAGNRLAIDRSKLFYIHIYDPLSYLFILYTVFFKKKTHSTAENRTEGRDLFQLYWEVPAVDNGGDVVAF